MAQRNNRRLLAPAYVVCLAALMSACGGGGSPSTASTTPAAPRPSQADHGEPLDALAANLDKAGLSTYPYDPGDAEAAITAGPPSDNRLVKVFFYPSAAAASKVGKEVEAVFDELPGRGLVAVNGQVVADVASEKKLTASEEAVFEKVVAVLEESE